MNQGLVLCCASSEAYLGPYETSMIGLFYETIHKKSIELDVSQTAFTCLKLTIETLEQGVKYVQSWP